MKKKKRIQDKKNSINHLLDYKQELIRFRYFSEDQRINDEDFDDRKLNYHLLKEIILKPEFIDKILILCKESSYQFFHKTRKDESIYEEDFLLLEPFMGIIFYYTEFFSSIFTNPELVDLQMYLEYKEIFKDYDFSRIEQERVRVRGLAECCMSAVNLYGRIDLDDFVRIYRHYYQSDLSENDIDDFLMEYQKINDDFYYGDKLLTSLNSNDNNFYKGDYQIMKSKPLYIPELDEFLKYNDKLYVEITPSIQKLTEFFMENEEEIEYIESLFLEEFIEHRRGLSGDKIAKSIMSHLFVFFLESDQKNKIIDLIIECVESNRVWKTRGFNTDEKLNAELLYNLSIEENEDDFDEIFGEEDVEEAEVFNELLSRNPDWLKILMDDDVKEDEEDDETFVYTPYEEVGDENPTEREHEVKVILPKVGPNEKCPCGSGKKYKKCCGSVLKNQ